MTVKKITSMDFGHHHEYKIDKNGNGWAYESVHPNVSDIKHKHEIKNWIMSSAKSDCYPFCKERFGYKGVPPHTHTIDEKTFLSNMKKQMSSRKNKFIKYKGKIKDKNKKTEGEMVKWVLPKKYKKKGITINRRK